MKLSELYEESQLKLKDTTVEHRALKKYLNEVLGKIDKFGILALGTDIEQIKSVVLNSLKRGVRLRCITEVTTDNIYYCKQLLDIVDELRHLDNIVGTFYVSNNECLVPESVHKEGKLASQLINWNVKETVKHQQYVFETLWNKALSAQQKINQIEKGELPEVIEIIHDTNEALQLTSAAKKEIPVYFLQAMGSSDK